MKDRLKNLLNQVYEYLFDGTKIEYSVSEVAEVIEYVKQKEINMYEIMPYELFKTIKEMEVLLDMKKRHINEWFDEEMMKRREGMTSWKLEKEYTGEAKMKVYASTVNPKHKRLDCTIPSASGDLGWIVREWVEDE